jgi:ABC-type dipeptide/oligopeptide/nickel transport system permease component
MLFFLVRRILLGLVVLWAITTVVFVMFFVAPSHVAQLIAGRQATNFSAWAQMNFPAPQRTQSTAR